MRKKSKGRRAVGSLSSGRRCFKAKGKTVCFNVKKGVSGLADWKSAAMLATNQAKGCLRADHKLKPGWKFKKGGECVDAENVWKRTAKAALKARGLLPCQKETKPHRVKKGWFIRKGKCWPAGTKKADISSSLRGLGRAKSKSKSKPRLSCQNKKTGRAKKGFRVVGRRCIPAKRK